MHQIMENITKFLETVKFHALENPVHAGVAAVAALGTAYLLFGGKRHLRIQPDKCIIVITGCDSGFGLMSCKMLSKMGYLVVAACLQADSVVALKDTVALAVQCDITKEADVSSLVQQTEDLAAKRKAVLWTVVNNAGVANSGNIDWISSSACRKVMEVNFFALFEVTRAFLPMLKKTKGSRIINLSSCAGLAGSYQMGPYCASKHAVEGLGKCLRQELQPWNIHVVTINPGFMRTPILQTASAATARDFGSADPSVVAQYDQREMGSLSRFAERLQDDPMKAVTKIVQNVTLARPSFNNPVGSGAYTLWCALCFIPQSWLLAVLDGFGMAQGLGPTPEALRRIQQQ